MVPDDSGAPLAQNVELYESILNEIRLPLTQVLNDALSAHQAGGRVPLLRLEAWLDNSSTENRQNEAGRVTLATIELASTPARDGSTDIMEEDTSRDCDCSEEETRALDSVSNDDFCQPDARPVKRRKMVGCLRLARSAPITRAVSPEKEPSCRRLTSDARHFPKRNPPKNLRKPEISPFERLIIGIWEQIHGHFEMKPSDLVDLCTQINQLRAAVSNGALQQGVLPSFIPGKGAFQGMNHYCRQITQASRCSRSLEVIVQARWIQCYDEHVQKMAAEDPDLSLTKARMIALAEASKDFGWSSKELRNKMAIWRGYEIIRDAGGWPCLVFAGMGLYRFCKYKLGFSPTNMTALKRLRTRFEVAADTIHPEWRQLLSVIGEPTTRVYKGHPCDWVVSRNGPPVPLADTYSQWTSDFSFEHLQECVIDEQAWGPMDPRAENNHNTHQTLPRRLLCERCGSPQSNDPGINECHCFPGMFGSGPRKPYPVQVFRTENGRNNGLLACCPFERGVAVGEFVGLVTRGLRDIDVMQSFGPAGIYQIWQGRQGNYTRFINHSCQPNSQYERFMWLGVQRIVLVSKGISAGEEITVDYSNEYWNHLNKDCLCGESGCRFKRRSNGA
ncbi:hypothetical protein PV05_03841 [Exophiala xenobiotica]|uniref:SET domain-containing protein n=1 Tax=Exophiala xenobiotica TaxID=348802 RepID=A0A0D2EUI9_9EURO|nr:uncharacterized protein PV05_03841 [Exophiala xenobiotica]KIW59388.1 hypothetical protein PV05_03841 [Exophiala xenobiotica]